ncbi:hypothetical protein Dsin_011493 [Dipteronia sinensis]|uniref:Endonuclease/exonuclease/phosphatase domain-containing protein n=1 Tax=Dipteronia sinensis TaxID=43782 RepID=A0AAE0EDK2_9ROSI|nr:hypothetical protein Dsin_011493 [Dipteronia sinensis]
MLALSWNIRGLGSMEKRRAIRNMVLCHKPVFLFIQETKQGYLNTKVVKSLGGSLLTKGVGVEAIGKAGGLVSLWNTELFNCKACISNERCIILMGELTNLKQDAVFYNVYAPNFEADRVKLWEFIVETQAAFPFPWCLGGDFNSMLDRTERKGGICNAGFIQNFSEFVRKARVIDLPTQGI